MTATTARSIDVYAQNEGTIFLVFGKTEAGQEWLAHHLDPESMKWGGAYVVEHRFVHDILAGALEAGLKIGGS